jgi:hypothetical protein
LLSLALLKCFASQGCQMILWFQGIIIRFCRFSTSY